MGLLKVRVVCGVNLACRDATSSDPYVVLRMGKQVISCLIWAMLRIFYTP
jgi:hypothetical protein